MVVVILIMLGGIIGFGVHFLMPFRFAKLHIDIIAAIAGSIVGAVISSPFSPPNEIGQKIIFLVAATGGSFLSVILARAAKI